jgi:tetratricopeptide (TPR) repeat protein
MADLMFQFRLSTTKTLPILQVFNGIQLGLTDDDKPLTTATITGDITMSTSLLLPPTNSSPETSLTLSQRAKSFFSSQSSWFSSVPYPLSLFINTESQEKWQIYENIFLACLRTGDNEAAYLCLEELTDRFGKGNDRLVALQGLYQEATAKDNKDLVEVMESYNEILKSDPTIFSIRKRRAALLRSIGKPEEAIKAISNILDTSPTDAEAWAELGDLYLTQGAYEQAIFCLEEVMLIMPNAWNMHAKLGEVLYLSAGRTDGAADQLKMLSESMRRFCRSIELCDDYLRGYYGLKLVSNH